MTRIIDIHTHVFPDTLAPGAISRLEAAGPVNAYYDGTVSGLVSAMDRAGVSLSVTQAVATKPSQVRSINEWAATTTSDRILPFGAMHPDVDDPAAEVEHAARLGIRGFKMHPEYQQFEPHEPRSIWRFFRLDTARALENTSPYCRVCERLLAFLTL